MGDSSCHWQVQAVPAPKLQSDATAQSNDGYDDDEAPSPFLEPNCFIPASGLTRWWLVYGLDRLCEELSASGAGLCSASKGAESKSRGQFGLSKSACMGWNVAGAEGHAS